MPEGVPQDTELADAAADGAYAHAYDQADPPKHFDANQRWAWSLGWRLQEHLEKARAEDE